MTRTFQPKRLRKRDLEAPISPAMRLLSPDDRDQIQARRTALLENTAPLGSRMRGRIKHYVIKSIIFIPLITIIFTPVGFTMLWLQILLAAAFGVCVAWFRPQEGVAGAMLAVLGALTLYLTGYLTLSLYTLFALIFYFVFGALIGLGQWLRRMDGE